MANLDSTTVTVLASWPEAAITGKRRSALKVSAVITSAGSGTATHLLPASAFGLQSIEEVSNAVGATDSNIYMLVPNNAGDGLLIKNAGASTPVDVTDTLVFVVRGQTLSMAFFN